MMNEEAREFLEAYARKCGDGDQGETVSVDGRQLKRSSEPQKRRYLSIFGEVTIHRYVYSAGEKKPIEYAPLDARLGLPAGEISYVLEDYQQRLCVQNVFAKSTEDLKAILGTGVPVGTAERMNRQMAEHASSYQLLPLTDENVPPPSEEGELLVVASDGKGVPIRRTLEERLQQEREAAVGGEKTTGEKEPSAVAAPNHCSERKEDSHPSANQSQDVAVGRRRHCASRGKKKAASGKGTKERRKRKGQKQMAYVGAVYTIDRFRRTADDVLDEVARRRCQQQRPRPQNKRVWGEMTTLQEGERINGRSSLFVNLAVDCYLRDPDHEKTLICLMDGEEPLWTAQRQWLPRAVEILDFFHAMEHLWTVARQFETGTSVERFVEHHARMFLEGKVDYAVRNFRRLMKERQLRGEKRREVAKAIEYFRHNRSRMQYHEYLAQGYLLRPTLFETEGLELL